MSTQIYEAQPFMNIREAIEKAQVIARGTNSDVIVVFNGARFAIKPTTQIQEAINTYLAVLDKITKIKQELNQRKK